MVGAIYIDSDSDRDSPRTRSTTALTAKSKRSSTAASSRPHPLSSSPPPTVIALSSSQDSPAASHRRYSPRNRKDGTNQLHQADRETPRTRVMKLLADSSPDTSLPTFRDMIHRHKSSLASKVSIDVEPSQASSAILPKHVSATSSAKGSNYSNCGSTISVRTGSLRRTTSQPVPTSSQDTELLDTTMHKRRRLLDSAVLPDIIEIGSDSIADPASEIGPLSPENLAEASSPIRSQFSTFQMSSSQPLPRSPDKSARNASIPHRPPAPAAATTKKSATVARTSARTNSAPIVILSSSPPPQSQGLRAPLSQTSVREESVPTSPPPIPSSSPNPPSSPIRRSPVKTLPHQRSITIAAAQGTSTARSRPLQRTATLLDALNQLNDNDIQRHSTAIQHEQPGDEQFPPDLSQSSTTSDTGLLLLGRTKSHSESRAATTSSSSSSPTKSKTKSKAAEKQAEKLQLREEKTRQREAAKAVKVQQMAEKRRWAEANRLRTSKLETMKELTVDLDRALFAPGQPLASTEESLKSRLEEQGAGVELSDSVIPPPMIRFRRRVKAVWNQDKRHWVPLEQEVVRQERTAIVYMGAEEIVKLVADDGLISWYKDLKERLEARTLKAKEKEAETPNDYQIFLLVQGLVKYYNKIRADENRAYTARIRSQLADDEQETTNQDSEQTGLPPPSTQAAASSRKKPTSSATTLASKSAPAAQSTVEKALLHLKFLHKCYVIHVAALVDGVEWIHQLVSDISIRPYKALRDTHLTFSVDTGRNTTSNDNAQIWSLMLQQIPRVTPSIASSITTVYPTFRSLHDAYETCKDNKDANELLSNIQIFTNADGTERRGNRTNLGLQLSKRIRAVLQSKNPDLLINYPTKDH